MEIIKSIEAYFSERKRDLIVLEMRIFHASTHLRKRLNREACEQAAQPQLQWFKERGYHACLTALPGIFEGWSGHYFIDVEANDPILAEYSLVFETPDGNSLEPDAYQLMLFTYSAYAQSLDSESVD